MKGINSNMPNNTNFSNTKKIELSVKPAAKTTNKVLTVTGIRDYKKKVISENMKKPLSKCK